MRGPIEGEVKLQYFEVTSREFDHFERISNALDRLDRGTYGTCTRCSEPIDPDVLTRRPWATLCVNCRDRQNRG